MDILFLLACYSERVEDTTTMGVPHITSFCWCMGLELGTKCIGFLHMLSALTLMIVCSVFAVNAGQFVGTIEDMDRLYSTYYKISAGVSVFTVVHFFLAFTLIAAVFKRWSGGVLAWVVLMSVLMSAALLCVIVMSFTHGLSGSGSEIFLSFLEGLVFFGVISYCILCVYSYYLMLKSAEDMEGASKSYY
ncbi:unnamed protein product [Arctia plantaginis]|uniref:Uncharacterized protein n=1 Tax=Arctia plantaginis TaxID=874455 RepID=A0A8S1A7X8_ARCPL|nr:unnamed protein product [Arctia plantaginis]